MKKAQFDLDGPAACGVAVHATTFVNSPLLSGPKVEIAVKAVAVERALQDFNPIWGRIAMFWACCFLAAGYGTLALLLFR